MKKIINIINFVRGCEPRLEMDLLTPLVENIKLLKKYALPSTLLLQYDALENEEIMEALQMADDSFEIGGWLEIVQSQAEKSGLVWRGEYSWDYHAHVDFPFGYSFADREKLIDEYMRFFFEKLGFYPKSMGSWMIDAYSLNYLKEKYGIQAACICKDQYGTDGYSLWGGYFNHGYYPSKRNMICPAQTKSGQIDLPVFRMLSSDPIHQYDMGLPEDENGEAARSQGVMSLEPVYTLCGGNPDWVDWYFRQGYNDNGVGFCYSQVGQENSFGWPDIYKGLRHQYPYVKKMMEDKTAEVMTLADTGLWFQSRYEYSPPCSMLTLEDWSDKNIKSVWYYSKYYRINLLVKNNRFIIRDLHLYDENYAEKYFEQPESTFQSSFDCLPVIDGYRFSKKGKRAGGYLNASVLDITAAAGQNDTIHAELKTDKGKLSVLLSESAVTINGDFDYIFELSQTRENTDCKLLNAQTARLFHKGYEYKLKLSQGKFSTAHEALQILSENNSVKMEFCSKENEIRQ